MSTISTKEKNKSNLHTEITERLNLMNIHIHSSTNKKSHREFHYFQFPNCNQDIQSIKELAAGSDVFINAFACDIKVSWYANESEIYKTDCNRKLFHQIINLVPDSLSWVNLLNPNKSKKQQTKPEYLRSSFEHDALRIVSSATFRKLQNKTQVIPLGDNDIIHNRLTHSIEVATVGKKLARMVAEYIWDNYIGEDDAQSIAESFCYSVASHEAIKELFINSIADIVYAACLIHDIGNPPFGHQGEEALKETYEQLMAMPEYKESLSILNGEYPDLFKIEGNAQTIRLLSENTNIDLTYATLASSIKYPKMYSTEDSIYKKFNIYLSEEKLFNDILTNCGLNVAQGNDYKRHPLVYLVEAADDICYGLFDFEDFVHLGFISQEIYCDTMIEIILPNLNAPAAKNSSIQGNTIEEKRISYKENITKQNLKTFDSIASKLRSEALFQMILNAKHSFEKKYDYIMTGSYTKCNQLLNKKGKIHGLLDIYSAIMGDSPTEDCFARTSAGLKKHSVVSGYNNIAVLKNSLGGYEIMRELLETYIFALHNLDKLKSQMILFTIPEEYIFEDILEAIDKKNSKSWVTILSKKQQAEQIRKLNDYLTGLTDTAALKLFRHLKGHEQISIN